MSLTNEQKAELWADREYIRGTTSWERNRDCALEILRNAEIISGHFHAPQSPGVEGEIGEPRNIFVGLPTDKLPDEMAAEARREKALKELDGIIKTKPLLPFPATPRKMTDEEIAVILKEYLGDIQHQLPEDLFGIVLSRGLSIARAVRDYYEGRGDEIDYKTLYEDLIYQVHNKIPGETRYETAKRIIYQHEHQNNAPQAVQEKGEPQ